MPPRMRTSPTAILAGVCTRCTSRPHNRHYASAAVAQSIITPPIEHTLPLSQAIRLRPTTQPASYKPPQFRKSQLLRQYASVLNSTPLMLLFQHNNLRSQEWVGIRRELAKALRKVDATLPPHQAALADGIKIQIVQTGIFAAALRVVEYYKPAQATEGVEGDGSTAAHVLSREAHDAVVDKKTSHALAPLLSGPLVLLTFPTVSPEHLKAALTIMAPSPPNFPAPSRRLNPGYHDGTVQGGLQKLLLMGARVEGKVFDVEGTRWVGGIEGGLDGLRGQLVAMLQGIGAGVTNTLESAAKNLYFTVEGRRSMLEEEAKESDPKA